MKKKIILGLMLFMALAVQAQEKERIQIGLRYNPPMGDDNELYGVTGGLDVRARILSAGRFNFGAGISGTYRNSKEEAFSDVVIYNPNIYGEFKALPFLRPYVAVGYAFYTAKFDSQLSYYDINDPAFTRSTKINYNGFSISPGVRFCFAKILFADLGLTHYTFQSNKFGSGYGGGASNYNLINIGFGVRF